MLFFHDLDIDALAISNTNQHKIDKRLLRDAQSRSNPYTQKWYRDKQRFISKAQKKALNDYFDLYGIELKYGDILDLNEYNYQKVILDIGFGIGDSLIESAADNLNDFYFGCEVMRSGVAQAIQKLAELDPPLKNCKVARIDATKLIEKHINKNSLDRVHVYFPDPWINEIRDGERRVIRTQMLNLLHQTIKDDGILHIVTDVNDYA